MFDTSVYGLHLQNYADISWLCFVDYILGTVHKSKGLEFDTVVVTDDFMKVHCARHNLQRMNVNPGS